MGEVELSSEGDSETSTIQLKRFAEDFFALGMVGAGKTHIKKIRGQAFRSIKKWVFPRLEGKRQGFLVGFGKGYHVCD